MASDWNVLGLVIEADWVEAWGTWFSGAVAASAVVYVARSFRREGEQQRLADQQKSVEQRRTQEKEARTVVLHDPGFRLVDGQHRIAQFHVDVGNYGPSPISNVTGKLTYLPEDREMSTGQVSNIRDKAWLPVVPADTAFDLIWTISWANVPLLAGVSDWHEAGDHFAAEAEFTDVHGDRWVIRVGKGQQPSRVYDHQPDVVMPQGLGRRVRAAARALRGS